MSLEAAPKLQGIPILSLLHSRLPSPLVTTSAGFDGLPGGMTQTFISQGHALLRLGLLYPFIYGHNCARDYQEARSRSPEFYGVAAALPPLGIRVNFPVKVGALLASWCLHIRSPKYPGSICGLSSHRTLLCPLVEVSPFGDQDSSPAEPRAAAAEVMGYPFQDQVIKRLWLPP